ncbi:hypothetical protein PROFUN_00596, partial [Planoprotostelium fungivorum]
VAVASMRKDQAPEYLTSKINLEDLVSESQLQMYLELINDDDELNNFLRKRGDILSYSTVKRFADRERTGQYQRYQRILNHILDRKFEEIIRLTREGTEREIGSLLKTSGLRGSTDVHRLRFKVFVDAQLWEDSHAIDMEFPQVVEEVDDTTQRHYIQDHPKRYRSTAIHTALDHICMIPFDDTSTPTVPRNLEYSQGEMRDIEKLMRNHFADERTSVKHMMHKALIGDTESLYNQKYAGFHRRLFQNLIFFKNTSIRTDRLISSMQKEAGSTPFMTSSSIISEQLRYSCIDPIQADVTWRNHHLGEPPGNFSREMMRALARQPGNDMGKEQHILSAKLLDSMHLLQGVHILPEILSVVVKDGRYLTCVQSVQQAIKKQNKMHVHKWMGYNSCKGDTTKQMHFYRARVPGRKLMSTCRCTIAKVFSYLPCFKHLSKHLKVILVGETVMMKGIWWDGLGSFWRLSAVLIWVEIYTLKYKRHKEELTSTNKLLLLPVDTFETSLPKKHMTL